MMCDLVTMETVTSSSPNVFSRLIECINIGV